jgi:hypothetical protein
VGTEPVQDESAMPEQPDPEIAAIQQSLLDDEADGTKGAGEASAAEPVEAPSTPEVAAGSPDAVPAPPAVAGFQTGRLPISAIVWPFVIYDLAWIAYASVLVWRLLNLPANTPVYEWVYYEYALWAGVALTALGPLLILVVWLVTRLRHRDSNGIGLATLLVGSAATLLGVAVWWGALIALDYVRLGSVF